MSQPPAESQSTTHSPVNSASSSPISYPSSEGNPTSRASSPPNNSQAVASATPAPLHSFHSDPPRSFRHLWGGKDSWGRESLWGPVSAEDAWARAPPNDGWGDSSPISTQADASWEDLDDARRHWELQRQGWRTTGSRVHDLNIAHYSRENNFGWTWEGGESRDETLDTLADKAWSAVQLHRSLKEAVAVSIPPPTFTGPQVEERLVRVQKALDVNQAVLEDVNTQAALLQERLTSIQRRQRELTSEAGDLRVVRLNLRDLHELANTWRVPPPPTTSAEAGGGGSQ
ncbi:hypothetical protein V5O48_016793 [Marasmius crinis-equi]|uniref:Uncharacterized protein n=1 Tax=Marasmius crinis-equi TaxID=585013 RepID=A0ABR3EQT7_9AGAR